MINKNSVTENFLGIASSAENPEQIEAFLALCPPLPNYLFIRQYFFYHKSNLFQIIKGKIGGFNYEILNSIVPTLKFNYSNGLRKETNIFVIINTQLPNISKFISISSSSFWNSVVKKIGKSLYPNAMPIFYKQAEIETALISLEKDLEPKFRIRISDVISKEKRSQEKSKFRNSFDTDRKWTDLNITDAFQIAKERNQWFISLKFTFQKQINTTNNYYTVGSGRINKYGEIFVNSFYEKITNSLALNLSKKSLDRLSLLDGRGLIERNYEPSKPLEIQYNYDAFDNIEKIHWFGRLVNTYPNASKAIFHANPYFHANIADFLDGSSFDVWVLSESKVVLIPQAKSTSQAFERFISYIFSNFDEGVVNDYQQS